MSSLLPSAGLVRSLSFLLCFLPLAVRGADSAPAAPRQEVKLLTVGNSFADNSVTYLSGIAKVAGKKLVLFRANLPAHTLQQHVAYLKAFETDPGNPKGSPYNNPAAPGTKISLREALQSKPWDVVTIQQASAWSFIPASYQPHANILIATIRQYAPQAEIMIHETWAYGDDVFPKFNQGKKSTLDQQKMYDGLKAAYQKLAMETGLRILPVGDAFQKARAQGIVVNGKENVHANPNGQLLGGAVFYEVLFQDNVENVPFVPKGMAPEMAQTLRRIAHQTVGEAAAAKGPQSAPTPAATH